VLTRADTLKTRNQSDHVYCVLKHFVPTHVEIKVFPGHQPTKNPSEGRGSPSPLFLLTIPDYEARLWAIDGYRATRVTVVLTLTVPLPSLVRALSWLLLQWQHVLCGGGWKKSDWVRVWSLNPKWLRRFVGWSIGYLRRATLTEGYTLSPRGRGLLRPWNFPYKWGKLLCTNVFFRYSRVSCFCCCFVEVVVVVVLYQFPRAEKRLFPVLSAHLIPYPTQSRI